MNAAKDANVARFVFVSFRRRPGISFPPGEAKAQVEDAVSSSLNFTVIHEICAVALRHPEASRKRIEFGGPDALSPLEVVARFEKITNVNEYARSVLGQAAPA